MNMLRVNDAAKMQIRSKFGAIGNSEGQFNLPLNFCLGVKGDIVVADSSNHRIQVFNKDGIFKKMFGEPGTQQGQLWYPLHVAVIRRQGKFVVIDVGEKGSRMQIFARQGEFIRTISIEFIEIPTALTVSAESRIIVVDGAVSTVYIISQYSQVIRKFSCRDYIATATGIAVRGQRYYVCDYKGHSVAVFNEFGGFLQHIGRRIHNCFTNGVDLSPDGDVLITSTQGQCFHVARYSRQGLLKSDFQYPQYEAFGCAGLRVTTKGYLVCLSTVGHFVLVVQTPSLKQLEQQENI